LAKGTMLETDYCLKFDEEKNKISILFYIFVLIFFFEFVCDASNVLS